MKIATVKGIIAKVMLTGLAAAGLMLAAPNQAQAQQFAVGVRVGQPAYVSIHDRAEFRRREEIRAREAREAAARREAFLRHEQWERAHRFDRRDYR